MLLISIIALVSLLAACIVLIWHVSEGEQSKHEEQMHRAQDGGRIQRFRRRQARAAEPAPAAREIDQAAAPANVCLAIRTGMPVQLSGCQHDLVVSYMDMLYSTYVSPESAWNARK